MNRHLISALLSLLMAIPAASPAGEKLIVVASLPALKSIAELVGGDKVEASAIASGYQNPHFVDPKPSFIMKLSKADVFITTGLDLETGWAPGLLQSSRNGRIQPGSDGYVDASSGIKLLQVPSTGDRAQGDIHIYGNPHYWMDPLRGKQIARTIADKFEKLSPGDAEYFEANLKKFDVEIDRRTAAWVQQLAPLKGASVIAYHNEWVYFEDRFGFTIVDFLEPKPGIPPTPSSLVKVISTIREKKVPVIITSPYFTLDAAEMVAGQTGARIAVLATNVGAFDGVSSYYDLFDYNVRVLLGALSGSTPK
jgi:zinc/manganese transport system substrate-binding protein